MQFGLDYITLVKSIPKNTKSFSKMEYLGHYYHVEKYSLKGFKDKSLECTFNTHTCELSLSGSLPYFIQGHNINAVPKAELIEYGLYLSQELGLNLFSFGVKSLEYGGVIELPFSPEIVFNSHVSMKGRTLHKLKDGICFYSHKEGKLKIYNPIKNMSRKVEPLIKAELFKDGVVNPTRHYLRIENNYSKPSKSLNVESLSFSDLFNPRIEHIISKNLLECYMSIEKIASFSLPKNKKHLSTESLLYAVLLDTFGSVAEIRDKVNEKLRQLPTDVLTMEDRKARNRHLRSIEEKFAASKLHKYDLTDSLATALNFTSSDN